jgi:hypothetical protein
MTDNFDQVLANFHYISQKKIANQLYERDQSNFSFDRQNGQFSDYQFFQLDQFNHQDVLVVNKVKFFQPLLGKKNKVAK